MINKLKLINFKCFKENEFFFKELNLLTGINSGGKSSVIQSLLLIKQNFEKRQEIKELIKLLSFNDKNTVFKDIFLNDKYVKLGLINDILNEKAIDDEIFIELEIDNKKLDTKIKLDDEKKIVAQYKKIENWEFLISEDNFFYLSANRISPKENYEYSREKILKGQIGNNGEYSIHYLAEYYNDEIKIKNLKSNDTNNYQFRENVSRWLGKISKGIDITAVVNDAKEEVRLNYNYGSRNFLPQNVGFGITYTLPIIILLLKAQKGDVIIIENPETHLHPAAQSELAKLCCKVAAEGVQLIIETHSDHFLNAIRVSVKENIISSNEVQVYYFNKNYEENKIEMEEIKIDSNGRIENWPKGFFDEWDIQLEKLLW